jgi:Berberine and berberine like
MERPGKYATLISVTRIKQYGLPGGAGTTPKNGESCGDAYVNFMVEEGEERVKASYRDNYERLAAVKSKYDPTNFFRVNQNIKLTL